MSLKIAIKVSRFPVASQTYIIQHVINLIDKGYDVTILCNYKNPINKSSQPELIKRYSLLEKTIIVKNYNKIKFKNRVNLIFNKLIQLENIKILLTLNPFKYGKKGLKFEYILHSNEIRLYNKFDIIHIHFGSFKSPIDVFKSLGLIESKIIMTLHGADSFYENDLKKKKRIKEFRNAFNHFDIITVNTKYLEKIVTKIGCSKHKLIQILMPIDTGLFKPKNDIQITNNIKHFKLLSVSRLIKLKTIDLGILAINELIKKKYSITYNIVGSGPEYNSLKNLISSLGLTKNIDLVGSKNQSEIVNVMQNSFAFVFPSSFDEFGRRETQGVVSGEAQAAGLPVIAFESGGIPYTLKDNVTGFLAREKDYLELASKIEILLNDQKLRNQMSREARNYVVQNYSINKIIEKWDEIYQKLIDKDY